MNQNVDDIIEALNISKQKKDESIKEYEIIRDKYYSYINGM